MLDLVGGLVFFAGQKYCTGAEGSDVRPVTFLAI